MPQPLHAATVHLMLQARPAWGNAVGRARRARRRRQRPCRTFGCAVGGRHVKIFHQQHHAVPGGWPQAAANAGREVPQEQRLQRGGLAFGARGSHHNLHNNT